jgi:hypothetical protein
MFKLIGCCVAQRWPLSNSVHNQWGLAKARAQDPKLERLFTSQTGPFEDSPVQGSVASNAGVNSRETG